MGAFRKMMAGLLAVISVAVAVQFVIGEIYSEFWSNSHVIWDYLNWLTGPGLLVILYYQFQRKRAFDGQNRDESVTFGYLSANLLLFTSLFLTLWFFANWFEELNINESTSTTVLGFVWIVFNACFIVLAAITAWQLWRHGSGDGTENSANSPQTTINDFPPGNPVIQENSIVQESEGQLTRSH